jgi:hypothetical protein
MKKDCFIGPDSVRSINLRLHKLEDPPKPRNENGAPLGTGHRISTKPNNSEASLDEETAKKQEAIIRGWVDCWRQSHGVIACHPFGYEVAP